MPTRRTSTILCVAALTILAWAYLVHLEAQMSAAVADEQMMAAMGMAMNTPWTGVDVLLTFGMWAVMMVGMMAPSATPVLLLAAKAPARQGQSGGRALPWMFGVGYFLIWFGFSAVAALVQWALHQRAMLSPAMAASSPRLAAGILIGAGIYQFTPFKDACLTHCRSPLDFLMGHWRSGRTGAFRMGAHHGAYCLGCCWTLMAVLFAVGVMNLAWVAALTIFVLIEKTERLAPASFWVSRIAGALLIVGGLIKIIWNA
jgi:predicted metal-binding membrane protein